MWNVEMPRQAGMLANLTLEMVKCKLSVIGLGEMRWPGKGEIVSGNYTMLYSFSVKAEKNIAIVLRNDVKRMTKVEC